MMCVCAAQRTLRHVGRSILQSIDFFFYLFLVLTSTLAFACVVLVSFAVLPAALHLVTLGEPDER
jgi:hypothetical protein